MQGIHCCRWYKIVIYHVCLPVRKIIHSLKLVGYLHVEADKPWYNYYASLKLLFQPEINLTVIVSVRMYARLIIRYIMSVRLNPPEERRLAPNGLPSDDKR